MAVVADFEANPVGSQEGLVPSSDTVLFADLSTGSPDRWLWDFGDGQFSDEQNPLHTYTGVATDTFTVKLTAWIHDSESPETGGSVNNQTKLASPVNGNANCFAAFQALSYGSNSQEASIYLNYNYGVGAPDDNYAYLGGRYEITGTVLSSLAATEVAYFIEARRIQTSDIGASWDIDSHGGSIQIKVDGGQVGTVSSGAYDGDYKPVYDLSAKAGAGAFSWGHEPVETILPATGAGNVQGIQTVFRIMKYTATSADNIDSEEKTDYVLFGSPPVAAFSASPVIGVDGMEVTFTNLSTEAIGLPTTYSWLKRVSGSGDSYVEFSTDENPVANFSK